MDKKISLKFLYISKTTLHAGKAYFPYNRPRLMSMQELFHGEPHLISVSRADRGYRGASIFHFPHSYVPPG